jgi:hypothetical protein
VHQAEPEALASGGERALERAKAAMRPEVPYFAPDADSHVQRTFAELQARLMGDVRSRRLSLASRAVARTAPLAERQLLLSVLHWGIVANGSDISSQLRVRSPERCLPFQDCRVRWDDKCNPCDVD